jgi:TPR repeat protein
MVMLGDLCSRGGTDTRDFDEAIRWYARAAERGHAGAMTSLGALFADGKGTDPKPAEAVRLFLTAAKAGVPEAMLNLAGMYRDGRGVLPSADEAYFWARNGAKSLGGEMHAPALAFADRIGRSLATDARASLEARSNAWLARARVADSPATAAAGDDAE